MPAESQITRRPSMAIFALFAIVMVIASYLFVICLAGACVFIPYFILTSSESYPLQVILLFLFGIVIAATMLWSLIPRRDKFEAPGMLIDPASQPKLFAELESIAAALNETVPGEVYLVGAANAFVADRGGILGFGSRRIMGLGLPLFSQLTVSQFRGVLAHEFAHYYGGDTRLGPWVYKTRTSMIRVFENIGSVGQLARVAILGIMYMVVTSALKGYFVLFLRAINFVSRRQEYRADELACAVAGQESLIEGLQSIHRVGVAWPVYWKSDVAPHLNEGSLVALGEGFSRFLSVPTVSSIVEKDLGKRLQEEKIGPYNTHPPMRDRIAALQNLGEPSIEKDTRPASVLIDNLASTELRFVQNSFPELRSTTLNYVPWDEVALRLTIPAWQKFVSEYSEALKGVTAESVPDQVNRFPEIGSRIRDPKGMLLSPPQRTARAGTLFAAALALRMIATGWDLQVQPATFHMRRGNKELNPFSAVGQLAAGKISREAWVGQCRELNIAQLALHPAESDKSSVSSAQPELFHIEASGRVR